MPQTEYEKMLAGMLYDAGDPELLSLRVKAREWMQIYNQSPFDKDIRLPLVKQLFGRIGTNVDIQTPVFVDYGCHIELGNNFFANFNCVFLDCNYIRMGDNVFLGP